MRPTRIRRILLVAGTEAKTLWFKSSAASCERRTWCGRRVAGAGASLTRKSERVIVKPQLTDLASARFAPRARQGLEIEGERPRPIFPHARASPKGTKELIWVHGRRSGDMMMDGVCPTGGCSGAAAHSFRGVHPASGGVREAAGAGRGHQVNRGQRHAHNAFLVDEALTGADAEVVGDAAELDFGEDGNLAGFGGPL